MIVAALRLVTAIGLVALLVLSMLPVFTVWPGDMIAPFRLQLATAALVGFCLALAFRRWRLVVLAGIALAATLVPMAMRLVDRPTLPESGAGHPISLVFANVLFENRQFERLAALARAEDSDIFAAAETTAEWVTELDRLKDRYPHSFASTDLGAFGLALYAKRPFSATLERAGTRGLPLIRADFGDMVVFVVHPMPPASERLTRDNREYLEAAAKLLQAETLPVIIAGDMNTTLWSSNIRPLLAAKVQWPAQSGMAYTWPVGRPWMAVQIDQVLTLRATAGQLSVLGNVGSDHYPVRADIVL